MPSASIVDDVRRCGVFGVECVCPRPTRANWFLLASGSRLSGNEKQDTRQGGHEIHGTRIFGTHDQEQLKKKQAIRAYVRTEFSSGSRIPFMGPQAM